MTYSTRRPLLPPGLGGSSLEEEEHRFDRLWDFVGVKAGQPLEQSLRILKANQGSGWVNRTGHDPEFDEAAAPVTALKRLWVRLGKKPEWWPGAQGEYNFGPTTYLDQGTTGVYGSGDVKKPANALRINREFHRLLTGLARDGVGRTQLTLGGRVYQGPYSERLWVVNPDGYVRLRTDDPLLSAVRANLVRYGYLPRNTQVSTKDNSAFVRAIRTAYEERRNAIPRAASVSSGRPAEIRATDRWWPSGTNFGPNTSGNELRVHPQFLLELLIAPPSAARKRSRVAMRGLKIKRPVLGTLPSVTGSYQKSPLVVPRLMVTRAQRTAAMTRRTGGPRLRMTASEARDMLRRLTGK